MSFSGALQFTPYHATPLPSHGFTSVPSPEETLKRAIEREGMLLVEWSVQEEFRRKNKPFVGSDIKAEAVKWNASRLILKSRHWQNLIIEWEIKLRTYEFRLGYPNIPEKNARQLVEERFKLDFPEKSRATKAGDILDKHVLRITQYREYRLTMLKKFGLGPVERERAWEDEMARYKDMPELIKGTNLSYVHWIYMQRDKKIGEKVHAGYLPPAMQAEKDAFDKKQVDIEQRRQSAAELIEKLPRDEEKSKSAQSELVKLDLERELTQNDFIAKTQKAIAAELEKEWNLSENEPINVAISRADEVIKEYRTKYVDEVFKKLKSDGLDEQKAQAEAETTIDKLFSPQSSYAYKGMSKLALADALEAPLSADTLVKGLSIKVPVELTSDQRTLEYLEKVSSVVDKKIKLINLTAEEDSDGIELQGLQARHKELRDEFKTRHDQTAGVDPNSSLDNVLIRLHIVERAQEALGDNEEIEKKRLSVKWATLDTKFYEYIMDMYDEYMVNDSSLAEFEEDSEFEAYVREKLKEYMKTHSTSPDGFEEYLKAQLDKRKTTGGE